MLTHLPVWTTHIVITLIVWFSSRLFDGRWAVTSIPTSHHQAALPLVSIGECLHRRCICSFLPDGGSARSAGKKKRVIKTFSGFTSQFFFYFCQKQTFSSSLSPPSISFSFCSSSSDAVFLFLSTNFS